MKIHNSKKLKDLIQFRNVFDKIPLIQEHIEFNNPCQELDNYMKNIDKIFLTQDELELIKNDYTDFYNRFKLDFILE